MLAVLALRTPVDAAIALICVCSAAVLTATRLNCVVTVERFTAD